MAWYQDDLVKKWNMGEISAGNLINEFLDDLVPLISSTETVPSSLDVLRRALTRSPRPEFTRNPAFDFIMYAQGIFQNIARMRGELSELTSHSIDILWSNESILSYEEQLDILDTEVASRKQDNKLIEVGETSLRRLTEVPFILAPDAAKILALRLISGLTFTEISARLGVPLERIYEQWQIGQTFLEATPGPSPATHAAIISFDFLDTAILQAVHEHPELLKALNFREFERLLARALCLLGYEIELGRGTKDGGVDIFAIKRDSALGQHRYLIQAKRWQNRVGIEPVRELIFLHQHYKATKSCLATTSTFTRGAWELAGEYSWQLELKDYELLKLWISQAARRL